MSLSSFIAKRNEERQYALLRNNRARLGIMRSISRPCINTCIQGRPVCVHCVMHTCIMVKVGGKENHRKHVQNTEIVRNLGGKFGKVGGMKHFSEIGRNGHKKRKQR